MFSGQHSASFLQRKTTVEDDGAVKVSVAGVSQPGKSISKRAGRLAQKWYSFAALFLAACVTRLLLDSWWCLARRVFCRAGTQLATRSLPLAFRVLTRFLMASTASCRLVRLVLNCGIAFVMFCGAFFAQASMLQSSDAALLKKTEVPAAAFMAAGTSSVRVLMCPPLFCVVKLRFAPSCSAG